MPAEKYTVIISGQRFAFTRDQLESEPGNYLATYFLGDFKEATNGMKEMELEKEPLLFKLIQAHLRGYKVIPIQDSYVPDYMSKTDALENLRRDADSFGLSRLVALIDETKRPESEEEGGIEGGTAGERIYRLSSYYCGQDSVKNADGSKQTMAITSDAVQAMLKDQKIIRYSGPQGCDTCWSLSKGWQMEAWLNLSSNQGFIRLYTFGYICSKHYSETFELDSAHSSPRQVTLLDPASSTSPAASPRFSRNMHPERYTVIVSGQRFVFTRDQLESEPGNYFVTFFLGDWKEASENVTELHLEKEPILFKLIQAHLRGYKVLPITAGCMPGYMTREGVEDNLLREAQFFGLSRLEDELQEEIQKRELRGPEFGGRKIYQLWSHWHGENNPNSLHPTEKVRLSQEGFRTWKETCDVAISSCKDCLNITPGWELEVLLREKKSQPGRRHHYIVESRLV